MSDTSNSVSATLSAEDTWTADGKKFTNDLRYKFESNSFVGTATIQARFLSSQDWSDIGSVTGDFIDYDLLPGSWEVRVGIKTGDYTSGSIDAYIDGERG